MKKQAKIIALILSLCLIFGVMVATTAFADNSLTETNQLDKSYLGNITQGVSGFYIGEINPEWATVSKTLNAFPLDGATNSVLPYYRVLSDEGYDSVNPARTNRYMEMRPFHISALTHQFSTAGASNSGASDYIVWDFDITATQYLIYFDEPVFVDRDGDGEQDSSNQLDPTTGCVEDSAQSPYNEYFTHALGNFEYDSEGNITAIKVDSIFFMEKTAASYFPRYLNTDLTVDTTAYSSSGKVYAPDLTPYSFTITDADVISGIEYHAAYDNNTYLRYTNSGGGTTDNFRFGYFDKFTTGGKYSLHGNVKSVTLSNIPYVWDHITVIMAFDENGADYHYSFYILVNGEIITQVERVSASALSVSDAQLQWNPNYLNNTTYSAAYNPQSYTPNLSNAPSFSMGYDNATRNIYDNNYESVDFYGIDDFVSDVRAGRTANISDCIDVVYDADYVSPNAYEASVVVGETINYYPTVALAAKAVVNNSTITIANDLIDYVPEEGITNFEVVVKNGAKFSLSDSVAATLYAAPKGDGSGYMVRPLGEEDVVRFDYYLGDTKLGEGVATRISGLELGAFDFEWAIVDRAKGEYVVGNEISWTWNMNDYGEYDPDGFYPVDLEAFDIDWVNEAFTNNGYKLVLKAAPQTETATGYMLVQYINGLERVVPNKAGYDYLQNEAFLTDAGALASAFRAEVFGAAANSAYINDKTVVLTCENLLPAGENAEDKLGGFDIFADTKNTSMLNLGGGNSLTLDLNGRVLTIGYTPKADYYFNTSGIYLPYTNNVTIYSSIPGGEIYESKYNPGVADHQQGFCLFTTGSWSSGINITLGKYINPNTGVIADGDNLSITGAAILNDFDGDNSSGHSLTIDGGYYYSGARTQYGMIVTTTKNTAITIKNADIIFANKGFGVFSTNGKSPANTTISISDSNILSWQSSDNVMLSLCYYCNAPITVSNSTVLANNNASSITVGNDCALVGSGWDNSAILADGTTTMTGINTTVSFIGKFNFIIDSAAFVDDGSFTYMSDTFFADVKKDFAVTPIYTYDESLGTPDNVVTITYKYGDTVVATSNHIKGSPIAHPEKTVIAESNGWYSLYVDANGWSVANGTVIDESVEITPVKRIAEKALKGAKMSVYHGSNIYFYLYLPQYKNADGTEVALPENLTYNVYTDWSYSIKAESTYAQVDAEGTQMMRFTAGNTIQPSQFTNQDSSGWNWMHLKYSVTIDGQQYDFAYSLGLHATMYAEAILTSDKTDDADKVWAYTWLKYLDDTFFAVSGGTHMSGAQALLDSFTTQCPYIADKMVAYRQELDEAVAAADNNDYKDLAEVDGVLGFAWVYSMGRPSLVIYVDAAKSTADDDTPTEGKIYQYQVSNYIWDYYTIKPGVTTYYYDQWGRTTVTVEDEVNGGTKDVAAIWVANHMLTLNDFATKQQFKVWTYDENGEKNEEPAASGYYSIAHYLKWLRTTEGNDAELASVESLFILSLAQRDFVASNAPAEE